MYIFIDKHFIDELRLLRERESERKAVSQTDRKRHDLKNQIILLN